MRWIAAAICLVLLPGSPSAAANGGRVRGRVELALCDGRKVAGEYIRLLLVTEALHNANLLFSLPASGLP